MPLRSSAGGSTEGGGATLRRSEEYGFRFGFPSVRSQSPSPASFSAIIVPLGSYAKAVVPIAPTPSPASHPTLCAPNAGERRSHEPPPQRDEVVRAHRLGPD